MSTPQTVTAVHPPHHHQSQYYGTYPDYQRQTYRPQAAAPMNPAINNRTGYPQNNYSPQIAPDSRLPPVIQPRYASNHAPIASSPLNPEMATPYRKERRADWNEFYKNGLPQEVIVIDDDSPKPEPRHHEYNRHTTAAQEYLPHSQAPAALRHTDKRRRVDESAGYNPVYRHTEQAPSAQTVYSHGSLSTSADARDRTASNTYSTAPTSLQSSVGSLRGPQDQDLAARQKRKRPSREYDDSPDEIHEIFDYYPPPRPPIKANDVSVPLVRDKHPILGQKVDDDDGHFIVQTSTTFAERYTIIKLLGQGTFGKVIEAYDKRRNKKVAVKIIRAVPKYRDASRIELRVLVTLAQNDKYNRNKCIHLRDCFDYMNHICIVTDLLSQSVFDFLKENLFVPFPSSHIQSFARQLFTSVAFLHDLNLIHTDLKPENILLVNNAYQTFTYNRNIPSSSKTTQRTSEIRKVLLNPEIRLIDFGSATFDDEYHSSIVSTRHYRAPEIILNLGWSFPCDIWSIGCILVEFFTGDALFQTHNNLEHLAMMEAVCDAKMDKDIIDKVRKEQPRTAKNSAAPYFRPKAYALDYPNPETPKNSKKYVKSMKKLEEIIPSTSQFNAMFLDLLRRIFVYNPRKRITAKQALNHPWFKELLQDDGTEALKIRKANERKAYNGGGGGGASR